MEGSRFEPHLIYRDSGATQLEIFRSGDGIAVKILQQGSFAHMLFRIRQFLFGPGWVQINASSKMGRLAFVRIDDLVDRIDVSPGEILTRGATTCIWEQCEKRHLESVAAAFERQGIDLNNLSSFRFTPYDSGRVYFAGSANETGMYVPSVGVGQARPVMVFWRDGCPVEHLDLPMPK